MFWYHNGTKIADNYRINVTNQILMNITNQAEDFGILESKLTITQADVNDTGLYQCGAHSAIATNFTVLSDEALVLVQGNPCYYCS